MVPIGTPRHVDLNVRLFLASLMVWANSDEDII